MAILIAGALVLGLVWASVDRLVARASGGSRWSPAARSRFVRLVQHVEKGPGRLVPFRDLPEREDTEEEVREAVLAAMLVSGWMAAETYRDLMSDLVQRARG